MKYIRTKDGIFEVANERTITEFQVIDHLHNRAFLKDEILADADTIEELCDCFVIKYEKGLPVIYEKDDTSINTFKRCKLFEIYGAIWTNKGLIYVAKMNDKGELVLI